MTKGSEYIPKGIEILNGEVWKKIPSLDYLYAASNYGRIVSCARVFIDKIGRLVSRKDKLIRQCLDGKRYYIFRAYTKESNKMVKVHRVVAETFINNPMNLPCVNHIDENTKNNNANNLEWCTYKYNTNYGTCQDRRSVSLRKTLRKKCHTINQYTFDGRFLRSYYGRKEIEESGFVYTTITRCCRHIYPKSQGFVWRYDNDPFSRDGKDWNNSKKAKAVYMYSIKGDKLRRFNSLYAAMKYVNGKSDDRISKCCRGLAKSAYGYIWRYAEEVNK